MTDINKVIAEVLEDIDSCAHWMLSIELCEPDGKSITKENRNELKEYIKSSHGKDYEICREDVWMEGLQRGYPLKVTTDEGEDIYVSYPKLAEFCVGVDIDSSTFDGMTVDCIIQRACFGKVIYG